VVRRFAERPDVEQNRPAAPLILLMFIGALLLVRRMRLLEMGDDSACALGVSVERSRLMLMLVAVLLTAAPPPSPGRSRLSPSSRRISPGASAGRRAGD
jgi:ABC-type enterobactin transport system permease subunit